MEQLKLLGMTIVLTVLIWASADSLVNEVVTVRVTFDVAPAANTNMLVQVNPDNQGQLYEMQVAGPRRAVDAVQDREPLRLRLYIPEHPTGAFDEPLREDMLKRAMVEQWGEFHRLSVLSVRPPSLPVLVDHMLTRDVDITLNRLSLAYDVAPQLKRSNATVRIRESRLRELAPSGAVPPLDISTDLERQLRKRVAGEAERVSVALDARIYGPDATLTPDTVEVTATVKADRMTAQIPTVPIKPVISYENLGKPYLAVSQDGAPLTLVTQTIQVTGPTEDVAKLLSGETRAFGFIQLKQADLHELGVLKAWTPEFYLPPNVQLAQEPEPIEFKLIDASQAETRKDIPGIGP